jgi:hypothetical protein
VNLFRRGTKKDRLAEDSLFDESAVNTNQRNTIKIETEASFSPEPRAVIKEEDGDTTVEKPNFMRSSQYF